MFEVIAESITHRFNKLTRKIVFIGLGLLVFVLGINLETISSFGPYMDIVSIYIIPIGASIGAITWFYVLQKEKLLKEINLSAKRNYGKNWYKIVRYIYVPIAVIITILALVFKISF